MKNENEKNEEEKRSLLNGPISIGKWPLLLLWVRTQAARRSSQGPSLALSFFLFFFSFPFSHSFLINQKLENISRMVDWSAVDFFVGPWFDGWNERPAATIDGFGIE